MYGNRKRMEIDTLTHWDNFMIQPLINPFRWLKLMFGWINRNIDHWWRVARNSIISNPNGLFPNYRRGGGEALTGGWGCGWRWRPIEVRKKCDDIQLSVLFFSYTVFPRFIFFQRELGLPQCNGASSGARHCDRTWHRSACTDFGFRPSTLPAVLEAVETTKMQIW